MKQNLHTHSIFCDGKDTIEEMTLEAISKGFDILGFSGHTGAIARGYRKTPYPSKNILEYLYAKNARICLNSDCHDKNYLDCAFESSLDLIQSCGFKELQILTNDGFVPVKIK